ncbi:MAG: low specificity L-threonine aldolase [Planctomycetes bacterium]|nr:low specificity L-threonine aldolase [Planctomycetota bacterium]
MSSSSTPILAEVQPGCQFASDNTSGICPEVWAAMKQANSGFAPGYGDDAWTQRATDLVRDVFETDCEVFFTFNGTAANSLALASLCQSYHSVLCSDVAHIETDECGGPEFFSHGVKLLVAAANQGKLLPQSARELVLRRSDIHYPKPRVISVTQTTELGTVYTIDELAALGEVARQHELRLHMDGARLANAIAALGISAKEGTWQQGVEVLSLGMTKNGAALGDAVVFFNRELAKEFDFRCKQAGQLASKMRFLAAPFIALLEGDVWLRNAQHANRCAEKLASQLTAIPNVSLSTPCQANSVFVDMPKAWLEQLRRQGWLLYTFIGNNCVRLMCSWKTTDDEINALVTCVQAIANADPSCHSEE